MPNVDTCLHDSIHDDDVCGWQSVCALRSAKREREGWIGLIVIARHHDDDYHDDDGDAGFNNDVILVETSCRQVLV